VHAYRHDQELQAGTLKTYRGFPHGMPTTHADTINSCLPDVTGGRFASRMADACFAVQADQCVDGKTQLDLFALCAALSPLRVTRPLLRAASDQMKAHAVPSDRT
jgi:hypothetical protein